MTRTLTSDGFFPFERLLTSRILLWRLGCIKVSTAGTETQHVNLRKVLMDYCVSTEIVSGNFTREGKYNKIQDMEDTIVKATTTY